VSDRIRIGAISGGQNVVGGNGHQISQAPVPPTPQSPSAQEHGQYADSAPVHSLHVYADIVCYSRFDAAQQRLAQDALATMLDRSLIEVDVRPQMAAMQDQGDARLLSLPPDADVAKALAVMPRHLNDELLARNRDSAPHAQLRLRMSFTMGPAAPGRTGLTGTAPVSVVRLADASGLRAAMTATPQSCLGMIIDHHLFSLYVMQRFRMDLIPDQFVLVHVSQKGFESDAWIRLF
jgi:hypothetical protein